MNRPTFLKTLAGGAVALPSVALANPAAENAIYNLFDAAVDARFSHDFKRLSSLVHPASLQMFRKSLSSSYDRLLKSCSPGQIAAVSGLSGHPKEINASDAEFFVAVCNETKERHPEFAGNPKVLPFKIHGTIFAESHLAHVLFSSRGAIHTERTEFLYVSPNVLSMKRDSDQWQIYSCILCDSIFKCWWRDLAKNLRHDSEALGRMLNALDA